jgi:hypothetical protein
MVPALAEKTRRRIQELVAAVVLSRSAAQSLR